MFTYLVYVKRNSHHDVDDIQYIHDGVSIKAAIFGVLWLLFNGLWLESALYIGIMTSIEQMHFMGILSNFSTSVIAASIACMLALFGMDRIVKNLERKGYVLDDVVFASSNYEAELRYLAINFINTEEKGCPKLEKQ